MGAELHKFRLFIADDGVVTRRVNLEDIRRSALGERCHMKVVDIVREPVATKRERVIATPALIESLPEPVVRVVGDMTDGDATVSNFGFEPAGSDERAPER